MSSSNQNLVVDVELGSKCRTVAMRGSRNLVVKEERKCRMARKVRVRPTQKERRVK